MSLRTNLYLYQPSVDKMESQHLMPANVFLLIMTGEVLKQVLPKLNPENCSVSIAY